MSEPTDEELAAKGIYRVTPSQEDVQKMIKTSEMMLQYMIENKFSVTEVSKICVTMVVNMFELLKEGGKMPQDDYEQHVDFFANTAIASITYLQDGHIPDNIEAFVNRGRGGEGLN